ncbi:MAG: FGGY family carbohydrate kinase [Pseudomonadales bacterium]
MYNYSYTETLEARVSETCFLILDQGGQSSRALVINAEGKTLACESMVVATQTPAVDEVEQDPEELVASLQQVAQAAVSQLSNEQRQQLVSAGLVTQRSSIVCWHSERLEAITPVISWQDRRAHAWLEQQKIDPHWFRHHTGLYPNAHYGASKIHWCLNNHPDVIKAFMEGTLSCGPLAGYLAARLTNSSEVKVDPANAQRTGLYNIDRDEWDADLLQLFDIPPSLLPQLAETCNGYGSLRIDDLELPLHLLSGDQSAAIYAHGQPDEGTVYINAGTGAFITALWPLESYPEQLLKSIVYSGAQSQYVIEATVNGAGSALNWAQKLLQLTNIDGLDEWASQIEGDEPPLFFNTVGGLGSPYWRANLLPTFISETSADQTNEKLQLVAVLESIVFLLQSNLIVMQSHGFQLQRLVISGGLSQRASFCQKLADLTNISVWRPNEVEASARGAAYLLAQDYSVKQDVPAIAWDELAGVEFMPGSAEQDSLNQRFGRWRRALQERLA